MATMEVHVQINARPEEVFAYLSDLEKHPQWSHIDEIKKTSEGPVGVGSTYESRGKNLGITNNDKVEVTEHQPNERFAWRSTGRFGWKYGWSFEMRPQEGGTLLIERFEPPAGLLGWGIKTFSGAFTRREMRQDLGRVKEKLEAG